MSAGLGDDRRVGLSAFAQGLLVRDVAGSRCMARMTVSGKAGGFDV